MQNALKIVDDTETGKQSDGIRLNRYLSQKTLQPFIYKGREQAHFRPLICYRGQQKFNGYEATILVDICDSFFRLNGWDFTVKGIKKRPGVIGVWTKKLIYEQLPKGVIGELEKSIPRSSSGNKTARFHQLLTPDIGHPSLNAQIYKIIALFQLSDSMKEVWSQFKKMRMRELGQLELPFQFDNKGHTIEVEGSPQLKLDINQEKLVV